MALKLGSSKQGKAFLADSGSNWVAAKTLEVTRIMHTYIVEYNNGFSPSLEELMSNPISQSYLLTPSISVYELL